MDRADDCGRAAGESNVSSRKVLACPTSAKIHVVNFTVGSQTNLVDNLPCYPRAIHQIAPL